MVFLYISFKPCYKWNTFNTEGETKTVLKGIKVLNLVINGIPSILRNTPYLFSKLMYGFKPCYKWNTFNTIPVKTNTVAASDSFKPCYKWNTFNTILDFIESEDYLSFKPCYKWNTFNTYNQLRHKLKEVDVLNLVINGIPSIPLI